jgi:hypothetical protein
VMERQLDWARWRGQGAATVMIEDSHGWATGSVQLDWVIHGQRDRQ